MVWIMPAWLPVAVFSFCTLCYASNPDEQCLDIPGISACLTAPDCGVHLDLLSCLFAAVVDNRPHCVDQLVGAGAPV